MTRVHRGDDSGQGHARVGLNTGLDMRGGSRQTFPDRVRRLRGHIPPVSDRIDHDGRDRIADSQAGYFTAERALDADMDRSTLCL